jgi:hypothetical protein
MIFMIIIRLTVGLLQPIFINKRSVMRPHTTVAKEIMMHTNAQTTVWGTPTGIGRARDPKSWYQQLRDWWTAHTTARQQGKREALYRCWDATRGAVTSPRAEAALDMAAAHSAHSVAMLLYGLSQ